MIARAPGKLVLSGAYVVLEGAPAIVAAVDRYAVADSDRPAPRVTAEVLAAIEAGALAEAPWFDASALRVDLPDGTSRKLGLGSSAAILAASILACRPAMPLDELFARALAAHRAAQGGGSGVDVAASVLGGVLVCQLGEGGRLTARPHALPAGTVVEVFSSPVPAETRALLAQVRGFAVQDPVGYRALMDRAAAGARAAVEARSAADLVEAVAAQMRALGELGDRSGAPIVTPEVAEVAAAAATEGAVFGPSGAGGGDIAIFVGGAAPSPALIERARRLQLDTVALAIGAQGASAGEAAVSV